MSDVNTGGTTPATNASNDSATAALGRVESFVKKALAHLEGWLHHPAAANATAELQGALDHVAEGKALAAGQPVPAVAQAAPAETPAAEQAEGAAAEQEGATGEQPAQ